MSEPTEDEIKQRAWIHAKMCIPWELDHRISHADLHEIGRQFKYVIAWLKVKHGYNIKKAEAIFQQLQKQEFEKLQNEEIARIKERIRIEKEYSKESWRLFFKNFTPYIGTKKHGWNDRIKDDISGHKTPMLKRIIMDNINIVDKEAITNPAIFVEKLIEKYNNMEIVYNIDRRNFKEDIAKEERYWRLYITLKAKGRVS